MSDLNINYKYFTSNHGGVIESAHVHRCTSYVAKLKDDWAYKNKPNVPKLKNCLQVEDINTYNNIIKNKFNKIKD